MVGLAQLVLDWAIFVLTTWLGMPAAPGNLLGRFGGMLLGFWLNGRFTFADGGRARTGWRRFARFLAVWSVLTLVSTWLVATLAQRLGIEYAWLAKPVVEAFLAAVSFLAMRHLVYR